MSVPVDLAAVRDRIGEYGEAAFLVTVNDDSSAHVTSVLVRVADDSLVVEVGRRTGVNLEQRPTVTLLWPPGTDPAYSLIIDATCLEVADGAAALVPTAAVLHRVADAEGDGPTCRPVDEAKP